MSTDLSGRSVIVTGASGGLGAAIARQLAGRGARLTLVARSAGPLRALIETLRADGAVCDGEVADVTDPAAVSAIVTGSMQAGPLWGCVNSAGTNRTGPTIDYALDDFEVVMDASVRGTFVICQAVGRQLLAAGEGGRIVNISSQMGEVGYPGRAAYCAAKHAMNGLTKALAVEWAPHGVTVNAVAPTFVETPMTEGALADPNFRDDVLRRIPAGRLGTSDEVADVVAFLMSAQASLVNGAIVAVDGGWTAW